ncbi:hypothetical protein RB195_024336 [Necator americanus]|uniref:Uncharacterized protein n=1 Tax=Necator americanus TaxID=51031 RepID=A0ABR1EQ30_NECAM
MAKASHTLQKGAVVQRHARAHIVKGRMPKGNMEFLPTNIGLVTLNSRSLSGKLQQPAVSRPLRYLHALFAALREIRIRNRVLTSIDSDAIHCSDVDEREVGGGAIAVRNDNNNLVEEFSSTSSRSTSSCEISEE